MPELEQAVLYFQNQPIQFHIRRSSRRRSVGITIDMGGVRVTAPKRMSMDRILELVGTKARWIAQKQLEFAQKTPTPKRFISGERFLYLGQEVVLEVAALEVRDSLSPKPKTSSAKALQTDLFSFDFSVPITKPKIPKASVTLEQNVLRIAHAPNPRVQLERWYKSEAERVIKARVEHYCQQLGWPLPKVFIRDQKRRWGSCNAKGELRFNWRLVMAPLELLDYVVVHEMAHLKVLDHSAKFWRLVERIMPDYKIHHKALNELGPSLYW